MVLGMDAESSSKRKETKEQDQFPYWEFPIQLFHADPKVKHLLVKLKSKFRFHIN